MRKKQNKRSLFSLGFLALMWVILTVGLLNAGQRTVRDEYGIPHIFGDTDVEMAEEYGYQAASDRLGQLLVFRRSALGTMAEVFGSGSLSADIFARTHGYTTEELRQMFDSVSPENQALLQAYVQGVNRYLNEVRPLECTDGAPIELTAVERLLQVQERDFTVEDIAAIQAFLVRRFGEIGGHEVSNLTILMRLAERFGIRTGLAIFDDLRFVNDPNAPTTIPPDDKSSKRSQTSNSNDTLNQFHRLLKLVRLKEISEKARYMEELETRAREIWEAAGVPVKFGSYAWTVSQEKSATGHALEFGGPQTGFSTPTLMHLVQLRSGEGFDVIGMAFVGAPGVLIGKTEDLAWTSTTGVGDNVDLYIEILTRSVTDPSNPPPYLYRGQHTQFMRRIEEVRVRGGETVRLPVFRSVHGPVATPFRTGDRTAITVNREHFLREMETASGFLDFNKAKSLDDFERGVEKIVTSHNFLYVDEFGNTAYWMAGKVRQTPPGTDQRLPLIGDGTQEQPDEFIPMPRAINPAGGLSANWNNKPRVDYDNGDSVLMGKQFRVSRIQELLNEFTADDRRMRFEEMNELNKDIASVTGTGVRKTFLLPYIEMAVLDHPTPRRLAALEELTNWNGHIFGDPVTDVNTFPGETIFDKWLQIMIQKTFGDELSAAGVSINEAGFGLGFTDSNPNILIHALDEDADLPGRLQQSYQGNYCDDIATFDVQETCEDQTLASLDQALTELEREFSSPDFKTWVRPRGQVNFVHPFSPFAQSLGLPPIVFDPILRSNRATYMHIINADEEVEGIYSIPLGQSGFIGLHCNPARLEISPHVDDLQGIFRNYEFIPMR